MIVLLALLKHGCIAGRLEVCFLSLGDTKMNLGGWGLDMFLFCMRPANDEMIIVTLRNGMG